MTSEPPSEVPLCAAAALLASSNLIRKSADTDGWMEPHSRLDLLEANNLMPIDLLSVKGQRSANGWGAEVSEYLD